MAGGERLARTERMPMLGALVPLAAGIVLGEHYVLPGWFLAAAFVLTGAAALLLRSSAFAAGMLLAAGFAAVQLRDGEPTVPRDTQTLFEVRVDAPAAMRDGRYSAEAAVTAWLDPLDGVWRAAADRIVLRTDSLAAEPQPGERILCRGRIRPFRGGAESYRRLMARRGYAGTLRISERNTLERRTARRRGVHAAAVERMRRLPLAGERGAVVRAMTAGDRSGLTPQLRERYARSGMAHLLALSGLHTGIVFAAANLLLWWLPLLRRGDRWRSAAVAGCVWLFVAAAGFPPSAIRAAVMCTLLQGALAAGSEYASMNALAAAAFGMLLWRPAWIGDISFQLSVAAVAGMLAWGVPLCRRIRTRRRAAGALLRAWTIGLAAWAATAPLVSHAFGIVPLAGVVLNPAAVALAGAIVLPGIVWMLLPFAPLAGPVAAITETAAAGIDALARLAAGVPGGVVEYTLPAWGVAAVYGGMVAAGAWMNNAPANEKLKMKN